MKSVANAAKTDSKSSSNTYACLAAMLIAVLFLLASSSGGKSVSSYDSLQSGQATHTTTTTTLRASPSTTGTGTAKSPPLPSPRPVPVPPAAPVPSSANKPPSVTLHNSKDDNEKVEDTHNLFDVQEEITEELDEAALKFEEAAEEELLESEGMLDNKIDEVVQRTVQSMDTVLGNSGIITGDDIVKLGEQLKARLQAHVDLTLTAEAKESIQDEEEKMEVEADIDAEDRENASEESVEEILEELQVQEQNLEDDLRNKVDAAIDDTVQGLESQAATFTKELLEAFLLDKTGSRYIVSFDDEGILTDFKKLDSDNKATSHGSKSALSSQQSKSNSSDSSSNDDP